MKKIQERNLCDTKLGKTFLNRTQAQTIKEEIKMDSHEDEKL